MEKNVGGYDRLARFIVGPILVIVGLAAVGGLITLAAGTLGLVLAGVLFLIGAILTVTAFTQKCPLNNLLGLNTYAGTTAHEPTTEMDDTKAGGTS